ncbi:MAG: CDP-alcohol phosphatidyltransferase family protein [bacterium]|nr:CDP-alcohol phosphatidyltransferase family protein [bacterium]
MKILKALLDKGSKIFDAITKPLERLVWTPLSKLTWLSPDFWCYLRIFLGVAVFYVNSRGHVISAVLLFLFALVTDWIDGIHARASKQVSEEGAKLDANADKLLIAIILLSTGPGRISGQIISMFMYIEGLLFLTANWLKPFLNQRYGYSLTAGSNRFGKIKMVVQSFAVGFLLINSWSYKITILSEYLLWIAIGFGIGSLLGHLYRMDKKPAPRMRIVTIPNVITLSGIILLLPAGFAIAREQWNIATPLLIWIFGSDWLDGWIARRYNQETAFGAVLDPVKDFLCRLYVIVWYFMWFDITAIRLAIVTVVLVELSSAIVNLRTAKKYRVVTLVNKVGKFRAVAHYLILGIVFFYKIGAYPLPEYALIGCFLIMLLCSVLALVVYAQQQPTLK